MLQKRREEGELDTATHFPYALRFEQPVKVVEQVWDSTTDYWTTIKERYTGIVWLPPTLCKLTPYEINVRPDEGPGGEPQASEYLETLPGYPRLVGCEPRMIQHEVYGKVLGRLSVEPIDPTR
jgi:hypothetical protein